MKKIVHTDAAPAAIGPYSQAVIKDSTLFISGQLPVDPKTGELVEGIEAQARQSLTNVKAILEEAGSSLEKVVRTGVFMKDLKDFAAMNAVYAEFFAGDFPARSCVQVAALPKDALVEIEVIADL
ncbi:RidA family protein [Desulfobaculum bizertense]|uniref:Endoribonuclease L-PSP n=1 Tax=Desulfobaculum bizertense DSM 18034 TaxID=1121442 RepID=A0A1T4W5M5_9BACT|nr:RidA family protein [Desulfobaculum bizertense]UIJ38633.1 RidA family protein [Desulfobaculum bizertense]SKA72345.1 endoribonuclease L-PSP [Desulfobaculum bizertense DSM 18034]